MLDALEAIGTFWRETLHIVEWSGLSAGALLGLGALFYFVTPARQFAIAAGIAVLIGWGAVLYGASVGRADVQAQWDAETARAAAAAARAATAAAEEDTSRAGAIEAQARDQHAEDLATIEQLTQHSAPACAFDDGDVAPGGVPDHKPAGAPAKPAARAKADHQGAAKAASRPGLWLSLVRHLRLQGQGRAGDAAPDRQ